jgi:nitroreductase
VAGDPLGPARGYRHALIEAGMVGERAYLAATALGLGVCGIGAFFDDELSALLALPPQRDWPVHLVTLGLAEGDD